MVHRPPVAGGASTVRRRAIRRLIETNGLRLVTLNMPNIDINVAAPRRRCAYSLDLLCDTVRLAGDPAPAAW